MWWREHNFEHKFVCYPVAFPIQSLYYKDRLTDFIHLFPFSSLTELLTICLLRYDRSFLPPWPFPHLHHLFFIFVSTTFFSTLSLQFHSTGASAENLGLYRLHSRETFRRYPYCRYGKFADTEYIQSGDTTFLSFFVEIWLPSYISLECNLYSPRFSAEAPVEEITETKLKKRWWRWGKSHGGKKRAIVTEKTYCQ